MSSIAVFLMCVIFVGWILSLILDVILIHGIKPFLWFSLRIFGFGALLIVLAHVFIGVWDLINYGDFFLGY